MSFPALLKRLLVSGLWFLAFLILFTSTVNAQSKTPNPFNTNPDVEANLHNGAQIVLVETMSAMICQLAGVDYMNPGKKCIGMDPDSGKLGFVENGRGMIGVMGTLIGYTFVPPASSVQYVAYLKDNFGIAKPTYAANTTCNEKGLGFCGLIPVLELWKIMRNLVYLLFILIFIIIGLAIMLRVHIDPRTVMTVQNQIPKIIIGIVLVTFSFAIAGLLVDVMYVASYLLGNVISGAAPDAQSFSAVVTSNNPFDAANKTYEGGIFKIITDGSNSVTELVNSVFIDPNNGKNLFERTWGQGDILGGILVGIGSFILGMLAFLIILIGMIFVLIRLWVILIFAYINTLLDIVFAPFWFLLGLVPGSSAGFGGWFRDMIANLSVYPATIVMLMMANVFVQTVNDPTLPKGDLFVPPLLGNSQNVQAVAGIIALGFLFMLPNVLTIMRGALKAPKIDYGPVFKPAGVGAGVIAALPKRGFETLERRRYAKSVPYAYKGLFGLVSTYFGNPLLRPMPPDQPAGNRPSREPPLKGAGGGGESH